MSLISGVVSGVIRPPVRSTLSKGVGGVPAFGFTLRDGSVITLRDISYLTGRAS